MKGFELKVKVMVESEEGYKEVSVSCGYDTTVGYTNIDVKHLSTDMFVASCVAHYIKNMKNIQKN